jgi:hypothetical protein
MPMEKEQYHESGRVETSAAMFVHGCDKCSCKFSVANGGGNIIDDLEAAVSYRMSDLLSSTIAF